MLLDRVVDSDEVLVQRARDGELAAFELLVHRHRDVWSTERPRGSSVPTRPKT